jgi:cyclase
MSGLEEGHMKRTFALAVIVLAGIIGAAAQGQQPAGQAPAGQGRGGAGGGGVGAIQKLTANVYWIPGAGGNSTVYVGTNGVVLVDTKLANWGQPILDKVRTVTDKPVTHIINTHTHGDHVGSNEFFDPKVEVIVQENTAANMAKMPVFADPAKKHGLSDRSFKDKVTVLGGSDAIDLYYFGPAHTNGDAFVVFRNLRVMHAGDAFSGPNNPIMDTNNGGTGVGYPATLAKAAAGITGVETVIPGHSSVTTWQAFVDYGEFMKSFVDSVSGAAKAGKTMDQALAEFKPADKFKAYNLTRAKANVETIYRELGR